jgi:sigma54-dependent transcription regulator
MRERTLDEGSGGSRWFQSVSTKTCWWIDFDRSRYDGLATPFQLERDKSISFLKSGMASQNEKFNRLIEQIEKVSL